MSTRATYTFKSHNESFSVYVHHDGYPTGAADKFDTTINSGLAWDLPRFEADEFGAAFIAANKAQAGSIRLLTKPSNVGDAAYNYTVWQAPDNKLMVKVESGYEKRTLWTGTLDAFIKTEAANIED